ncbi:transposase, IS4 family [Eubacterium ramulus ATCC 29099]|uniref:Transposase, IS4 family n=2 Tax=Eubacterium ramulus TaxID=39490 RepID=U2RPA2_EUBRA|nr:transposase, IS4 family [Eubacterium ramulus ATCC 29099]
MQVFLHTIFSRKYNYKKEEIMYLNYVVDIPKIKGKITFRNKGKARYVYYECDRIYDPSKQYTTVKRVTIGKISDDDETKMRPNENFRKYFPEVDVPESLADSERSSCLKAGTYMVINQVVKNTGLNQKLEDVFGAKAAGMILDFAAYSIITESNAAQYYPDYAFNHPLFTEDMKIYSDSTLSEFFRSINENQRQGFLDKWNEERNHRERIYVSYDSTNKNCEAGNISMVEYGAAKVDAGLPIFNYAAGYDLNNSEPLMYEKYPGSINDVSQVQFMIEKVKGYGYRNIGFILDRGYFSKENLRYMDNNGFSFIIMVKGCKEFIRDLIRKHKGSFESDWGHQISEFGVYGKTVQTFVYAADTKKRYVHVYYNAAKAAGERSRLEENIREMQNYLARFQDTEHEFGPMFHKYFHMHYNKETGHFVYGEPNLLVIREELDLCGYFAIISSEKMEAKEAIGLYKNRDASEKVFRADKSYLGNNCLRVASEESASTKIFIGFIALIIRCKIYQALKNKAKELVKKPNYLTVPAAIRELEKIEMNRQLDKVYRLDHAVTNTQKVILDAFDIDAAHVTYKANCISEVLKGRG